MTENRVKKFLNTDETDPPNVGNLVHWEIKQRNIKKKDVAQRLGIIPTTLNQYFKQPSLQTIILWRLSKAVNYNFLMYLGEKLGISFETQKEKTLLQLLQEKEKEIENLKTQLGVYKQIHKIDS